jgi:gamma-glutamyl:cysteine ligase YbdK (ATP-grasp superfamily)
MSAPRRPYRLFEAYGVEVEYMVVDRDSYDVRPLVDRALAALAAASPTGEPVVGPVEWSNELVAHVVEAKCARPVRTISGLRRPWNQAVRAVNVALAPLGATLLPSAAHPWMNPRRDARLWPHEGHEIYAEYDRIFGCVTHGWTNLQSVHLNLPFGDDVEFGQLHAAIRVALPLIPALAAASPYLDGAFTGLMDARMEAYRVNSLKIPAMTGRLVPEPVFTEAAYRREILEPIYAQTAPHDPQGILRDEWANARGAIARFDRRAIEIRVIDSQESPQADLAVAHAVATLVRLLVAGRFGDAAALRAWDTETLRDLFFDAVRDADRAAVREPAYAALFGLSPVHDRTFGDLWKQLFGMSEFAHPSFRRFQRHWCQHGPLARRLVARAGASPSHEALASNLRLLRQCLDSDTLFP